MTTKNPNSKTELLVLGCGTSSGVPLLFCNCPVCKSKDPKNKRLRASVVVTHQGKRFLIDTGTDLRQQALRFKMQRIDAVLYTHPHADHVHGIDELRSFNFAQKERIAVYGNAWTHQELLERFGYIFGSPHAKIGGAIPQLSLHLIDASNQFLTIAGAKIQPVPVSHGKKECVGYRFDRVAYVTDCSYIPETSYERLMGLSVLVLDCVRLAEHATHLNLERALEIVDRVKPKKTFLTHLGHDFDYKKWSKKLPRGVALAYDGLKVRG